MQKFEIIGVVGAGTMGSALAQKFAQEGFTVVLADLNLAQAQKGLGGIRRMLEEGVNKKVFTPQQAASTVSRIAVTDRLENLKMCDLVVEAIYENFDAKADLFKKLSAIVSDQCILATNTSSFSVSDLASSVKFPSRFIGLHFFYHAAKNRLVEIIPGALTSPEVFKQVKKFAVLCGKDAITCSDAYGFVVNRFFVPWLNEAVRVHEENVPKESIDLVCKKVFGIGMGPFELMNATGVPVAYHSQKTLEVFGPMYKVAPLLQQQANSGSQWSINSPTEEQVSPAMEKLIRERMLATVFFVCSELLEEKVCTATAINRGARIGLQWKKGPIDLMRELGTNEVARLLLLVSTRYNLQLPATVGEYFWNLETVHYEKIGKQAVITMDEPESLNALSEASMRQLAACFDSANTDPDIDTIFITGSGKAFVAGADIRFFVKKIKNERICDIESFTGNGQQLFNRIERSEKKVVALINGLALGGGLELALCADLIFAAPKAQMAFPETGIGIYPGLGGTQRSSARIGKGLSKYLIHTGQMLNAAEAREMGLIDGVLNISEILDILEGSRPLPLVTKNEMPARWQALRRLFDQNSIEQILEEKELQNAPPAAELEKIRHKLKQKAPIALRLADKLISEEKGCESELAHLREVFSTSDALLGLTSIGKKVQYTGN